MSQEETKKEISEETKETVETKEKTFLEKVKGTGKIVLDTFKESPMLAVMFFTTVAKTAYTIVNVVAQNREQEQERCTTHDSYAEADLVTTHELTNGDILEMTERMKQNGQTKVEALNDMGLLKREKRR